MGEGLVEGAVLGAVLQEGMKPITEQVSKARRFKSTRRRLESLVERVMPVANEMKQWDEKLERPKEETQRLIEELEQGKELVKRHSKVPWWKFCCLGCYQGKLQGMDEEVSRSITLVTPVVTAREVKETLSIVRGIQGRQFKCLCDPPEKPQLTVGLDGRLNELRNLLLEGGKSVLALTGLAGCGKTTLVTLLSWDEQVRGKFGENIFFLSVSKTPNLKIIVQTLFRHCGLAEPGIVSDGHAVILMRSLLKEIGRISPVMLILDDVWPGAEAFVEKLQVELSDYKILVTSRCGIPRFGNLVQMTSLDHDDAVLLFRHFAKLKFPCSNFQEELVQEIVRGCKGSPLALEVIGGSLCMQPFEVWITMKDRLKNQSILKSNKDLLSRLQNCLDILEDESSIKEKECFMDLGLFPEDQRIRVPALIDMWTELYGLDEDGMNAMNIIHNLTNKNLVNLIDTRRVALDTNLYYSNHFLTQHDLLRELAIHQSSQQPFEQRERLIIDLSGNNRPQWWVGQNQQGIISRVLPSFFPIRWMDQKQKKVAACRTLSISTDETFTSDWCNRQPDEAEVLVLNIRSSKYTLPEFTDKMSKLKVVIVTNYGFHASELGKFELLGCLSYLKRIRLEKVSIPCLCKLMSLQKLSIHMCNTRQAFESSSIQISDALPNLVEMNIDYCNDLVELPSGVCKITTLKKLSITNCHKLSALPQDIGKLENLEVLRLISCSDLLELPESVERLHKLRCLDISDCVKLTYLPVNIGDLLSLEKLYLWGCSRLNELPPSVRRIQGGESVGP